MASDVGETLVQAFAICAAIHVGFIAFGVEEWLYGVFGGDAAHVHGGGEQAASGGEAAQALSHGAGEILSSADPDAFAECVGSGGSVHAHGAAEMACTP